MFKLVAATAYHHIDTGIGHYTTFLRSPADNTHWIHLDDAKVTLTQQMYSQFQLHLNIPCCVYGKFMLW